MDRFEELYEMLERELSKILSRGELNGSSLDMVYKLTCSMKNLKKIMNGGYSNYSGEYGRNYSNRDYSREGYSREDYSRNYSGHGMREHLEEAMKQAKDDRTRNELMRMLERM